MAKTLFSDGNPLQGILGTIVSAAFLNKIFSHRHDGLDQDGSAPLDYAPDTGAANAYAIALAPALTAHVPGLPIHFKATNANTGASTLAVNGLAAVAIKQVDGSALPAGAIVAGQMVTVIYTGAAYMMVSGRGIATNAEVLAGTDKSKSITPYGLLSALGSSFAPNGYQKLPSGLIIQWGGTQVYASDGANGTVVSLPVAFPTALLCAQATDSGASAFAYSANGVGSSQLKLWAKNYTGVYTDGYCFYFTIGY